MRFKLQGDKLKVEDKECIKSGTINFYEADVEHDETWAGHTIKAIIICNNVAKEVSVINNKVSVDVEKSGADNYIGFVGYVLDEQLKTKQITTELIRFPVHKGAGEVEAGEGQVPSPTQWEIYIAQIQAMINDIHQVPVGGTTGQVLKKKSNTDFDTEWADEQGGSGGTSNYNNLSNKPKINNVELSGNKTLNDLGIDIPTTLAELTEDGTHRVVTDTEKSTWNNKSNFSGNYNDLSNKPNIPTKYSDLTNDTGKVLSTEDYTTAEKTKLDGIETGAEKNTIKGAKLGGASGTQATVDSNSNIIVPISGNDVGLSKFSSRSFYVNPTTGEVSITNNSDSAITNRQVNTALSLANLDTAVKFAMTDGIGAAWTDLEKANARARIGAEVNTATTLPATAVVGTIYDLGSQSTVSINLPSAQLGDWLEVMFISGATATTLSISSSSGLSEFTNTIEANKIYTLFFEWINLDGTNYGWGISMKSYTKANV